MPLLGRAALIVALGLVVYALAAGAYAAAKGRRRLHQSARDALELATRGGAACLGRTGEIGELSVGACGDLAVWPLDGVRFAGALSDPVEAWLRCGPVSARHTVVGGRLVVEDGVPVHAGLDEQLAVHRRVSARMQATRLT